MWPITTRKCRNPWAIFSLFARLGLEQVFHYSCFMINFCRRFYKVEVLQRIQCSYVSCNFVSLADHWALSSTCFETFLD
jgi:hypothetical protein